MLLNLFIFAIGLLAAGGVALVILSFVIERYGIAVAEKWENKLMASILSGLLVIGAAGVASFIFSFIKYRL